MEEEFKALKIFSHIFLEEDKTAVKNKALKKEKLR